MQVRIGKTITSFEIAKNFGAKNVLFLTKKKAISSIENDYKSFKYDFDLTVINDESIHKVDGDFDLVVHDEHHRFGAFPKPNKTAKTFKDKYSHLPMVFLSGTPTPESWAQWYHQFWISEYSPFREYSNFYKWADEFVNITKKYVSYGTVNDYSGAEKELIDPLIKDYILTYTQKEAGFVSNVVEQILEVEMLPITYQIISKLKKDLVVSNNNGQVILADTAVKLMQKVHQISSGTCKFEDGTSKVIDYSKAEYIKNNFTEKIAIFYKFKEELNALENIFGDSLTSDLGVFNSTDKNIALQIVTGREGISLKEAKCLVYYNIDFSAVSYWQSRDRLTTMDRLENKIYWIFSKGGIENDIYKTVLSKKNYTLSIFKKND